MRKITTILTGFILLVAASAYAEDQNSSTQSSADNTPSSNTPTQTATVPVMLEVPAADNPAVATAAPAAADITAPASTPTPAPAAGEETTAEINENLEFISGEVSSVDETAKKVTVKLYGETEGETTDKILAVSVDETTDITDGEKDRELKSLTAGTEVDVEYDPATGKATYIFVY